MGGHNTVQYSIYCTVQFSSTVQYSTVQSTRLARKLVGDCAPRISHRRERRIRHLLGERHGRFGRLRIATRSLCGATCLGQHALMHTVRRAVRRLHRPLDPPRAPRREVLLLCCDLCVRVEVWVEESVPIGSDLEHGLVRQVEDFCGLCDAPVAKDFALPLPASQRIGSEMMHLNRVFTRSSAVT